MLGVIESGEVAADSEGGALPVVAAPLVNRSLVSPEFFGVARETALDQPLDASLVILAGSRPASRLPDLIEVLHEEIEHELFADRVKQVIHSTSKQFIAFAGRCSEVAHSFAVEPPLLLLFLGSLVWTTGRCRTRVRRRCRAKSSFYVLLFYVCPSIAVRRG